jgi:hypothetical protein
VPLVVHYYCGQSGLTKSINFQQTNMTGASNLQEFGRHWIRKTSRPIDCIDDEHHDYVDDDIVVENGGGGGATARFRV